MSSSSSTAEVNTSHQQTLLLESKDVARGPPCNYTVSLIKFTTNGSMLCLYPDKVTGMRTLYEYNLEKKELNSLLPNDEMNHTEGELSLAEQLRRERMRNFSKGLNFYEIVQANTVNENRIMIPTTDGQICIYDKHESFIPKLWVAYDGSKGAPLDPHISSVGDKIAFVLDSDLYCIDILDSSISETPRRITFLGAAEGISCGLAEFVAQEEMDRYRGFWWSPAIPNSQQLLLFAIVDENPVKEFTILHVDIAQPRKEEKHRYPFAGEDNAIVRLAIVNPDSLHPENEVTHLDLGGAEWESEAGSAEVYLARAGWWLDGAAMAQVVNRDQSLLQLLYLTPGGDIRVVVLQEKCGPLNRWINLHDMLHMMSPTWRPSDGAEDSEGFYFIWASSRTGFCRLFLYHYNPISCVATCMLDNKPIGADGNYMVDSIDGVDEETGLVYFSATIDGHTEKHLYCCSLSASEQTVNRISRAPGWHSSVVCPRLGLVADAFSSMHCAPMVTLYELTKYDNETHQSTIIFSGDGRSPKEKALLDTLKPPKLFTATSSPVDGKVVDLTCCAYFPDPDRFGSGPYPTIVAVYGGPHVQRVMNHWVTTADMRAQRFAQEGFLVIKCDNRGSSRRGCSFENAIWLNMGDVEILDQVSAVDYFSRLGFVDTRHVGIYGWSYGGYMSAMALCKAPDVFKCACAGAPVTFWQGYDTFYTERYMSTPEKNPEGYRKSAVTSNIENITGSLLIIHGIIDENVHIRHTFALADALNKKRIPYDLLVFPNERHSPQGIEDKVYMEDRIRDFFISKLKSPKTINQIRDTNDKKESLGGTGERMYAHL